MYTALDAAAPGVRAGFGHVPSAREAVREGAPALPLDDIARALEIAVRTCVTVSCDLATPAGTLH